MFEKLLSPSLSGYEALDQEQVDGWNCVATRPMEDKQLAVAANTPSDSGFQPSTGGGGKDPETPADLPLETTLSMSASENLSSLKLADLEEEEISAPVPVFLLADPLEKSFSGDVGALIETAVPVKRWFRSMIALVQLIVGGICIQVGMREEDTLRRDAFCDQAAGDGSRGDENDFVRHSEGHPACSSVHSLLSSLHHRDGAPGRLTKCSAFAPCMRREALEPVSRWHLPPVSPTHRGRDAEPNDYNNNFCTGASSYGAGDQRGAALLVHDIELPNLPTTDELRQSEGSDDKPALAWKRAPCESGSRNLVWQGCEGDRESHC
eukprot:766742-Hanusia_phi.AAC.2